jgi:hypothetical protein
MNTNFRLEDMKGLNHLEDLSLNGTTIHIKIQHNRKWRNFSWVSRDSCENGDETLCFIKGREFRDSFVAIFGSSEQHTFILINVLLLLRQTVGNLRCLVLCHPALVEIKVCWLIQFIRSSPTRSLFSWSSTWTLIFFSHSGKQVHKSKKCWNLVIKINIYLMCLSSNCWKDSEGDMRNLKMIREVGFRQLLEIGKQFEKLLNWWPEAVDWY